MVIFSDTNTMVIFSDTNTSPDLLLRIADPTQILSIVPSHDLVHFTPDRAWRSDVCFKNLQTTSIHSVFKVKLV